RKYKNNNLIDKLQPTMYRNTPTQQSYELARGYMLQAAGSLFILLVITFLLTFQSYYLPTVYIKNRRKFVVLMHFAR
ncbi:hypothetical protein ACJX0J_008231, partial [Zea mays]